MQTHKEASKESSVEAMSPENEELKEKQDIISP